MLKLMILISLIFSLSASAGNVLGQTASLKVKNQSLTEVFRILKEKTDVDFLYTQSQLQDALPVNIDVKDKSLKEILDLVFEDQSIKYDLKNNTVIIKETANAIGTSSKVNTVLQQRVTGKVTDENGIPLLGVTVAVKGRPQIGTTTDGNGVYTLLNLPENSILVYRYIGYLEQEISIDNQSFINVSLVVDQAGLEEVVVVGFGRQKKESVVASVATIKGEQLRMPNRSLSNNLAGQLPGLISVQRSGEPGYDNAEFWIRGVSSFAGGTSPLVLVDGVPRDMNDIEPDEIETFTLLKDAVATSVYGSEGANGVVLITSKRGRVQKTSISYRGEASRLTPTRTPRFANSFDFLSLYNEAKRNDGQPEVYSESELLRYKSGEDPDLYPNADWWGAIMKDNTSNTRHSLNFRGGGDRMKYFVSGAYFGESGLYKVHDEYNNNAGVKRYNLRSNVDIDISKSTLLRVDLSGQYLQANRPLETTDRIFKTFYSTPPHLFPVVYSDGTLSGNTLNPLNPYNRLVERGYRKEWRSAIQSKVDLEQKLDFITQGLKARGAISYDSNSIYFTARSKQPEVFFAEERDMNGKLVFQQVGNSSPFGNPSTSSSGNKNVYMETALNYNRAFNKHNVEGMFLYYQKEEQKHNNALAFRKQAWVGRSTYAFDNRYMLEANFSVTGSEQFADGYRYGFFPAVGLAWNVMNEHFISDNLKEVISGLKLRASIGRTGNDNTGSERFLYRPTFATGESYGLGIGSTGEIDNVGESIIEDRFESPHLSWEIELKRNIGIDLSLFNGKIDLIADYFDNRRTDILQQRSIVSDVAGYRKSPWQNYGEVSNKGVDGSLNLRHRVGEVDLSFRGNFTFARNKILKIDEIPKSYPWLERVGTRLNTMQGLVAERLFVEEDFNISTDNFGKKKYKLREGLPTSTLLLNPLPGDIKYVDQNGDGTVDTNFDVVQSYLNPTIPEIIYGFGMNIAFKGAYINLFFQGADNVSLSLNSTVDDRFVFIPFREERERSVVRQEVIESRWTQENPSQDVFYPRLSILGLNNTSNSFSTWWFRDASFLRLKNVEIGYSIPKSISSKVKLNSTRLYLMGQNIALWDKVKVQDPELGTSGGGAVYPLPSIWTLGLDITF